MMEEEQQMLYGCAVITCLTLVLTFGLIIGSVILWVTM